MKIDRCSWGSVFLGVAPRHASAWNGYGFLNYRACQAYGSETLYGAYYAVGEYLYPTPLMHPIISSSGVFVWGGFSWQALGTVLFVNKCGDMRLSARLIGLRPNLFEGHVRGSGVILIVEFGQD